MVKPQQAEAKAKRGSRRSSNEPTVADVARAAGVSPMTVSRVVNKSSLVSETMREKVLSAIGQLGYVPNLAARSLAGGRQMRLALLHDNPSAAWLSEVLVACLKQASFNDAQLLVEHCESRSEIGRLVQHLVSHRIDGVILPPPMCDDASLLTALEDAGIAKVQLATGTPSATADAVGIDEHTAALAMTRHLLERGHRRIGFIVGNAGHSASALRQMGYEDALREAGIPVESGLIVEGDFSYRSGLAAALKLIDQPNRPTAIFASNDDMAAAVIAAAHQRGLEVPRQLSVCGFDDTAMATMIWPRLTTIHQPIAEIADTATLLLISAVRAKASGDAHQPQHKQLPFTLICRESDGAPEAPGEQG